MSPLLSWVARTQISSNVADQLLQSLYPLSSISYYRAPHTHSRGVRKITVRTGTLSNVPVLRLQNMNSVHVDCWLGIGDDASWIDTDVGICQGGISPCGSRDKGVNVRGWLSMNVNPWTTNLHARVFGMFPERSQTWHSKLRLGLQMAV